MPGPRRDDADDQGNARPDPAAALADRVARLSASASGAERAIRVTVGSSGAVTGLELDDRVQRMAGAELAEEIMRVMRRAQAGLTEQVARAVEATVGADTDTGRAVLDSFTTRFPAQYDGRARSPVMPSPPPFPSFETRATGGNRPGGNRPGENRPAVPRQGSGESA